jgi:hypothetical protein
VKSFATDTRSFGNTRERSAPPIAVRPAPYPSRREHSDGAVIGVDDPVLVHAALLVKILLLAAVPYGRARRKDLHDEIGYGAEVLVRTGRTVGLEAARGDERGIGLEHIAGREDVSQARLENPPEPMPSDVSVEQRDDTDGKARMRPAPGAVMTMCPRTSS